MMKSRSDVHAGMKWTARFNDDIKRIIAPLIIVDATPEEDMERNTDMMVLSAGNIRIMCRVRKWPQRDRFVRDFTIRSYSNGLKTEIHKVLEGWGDYLFYGLADKTESRIHSYRVMDMQVFRDNYKPGHEFANTDGQTKLMAFSYKAFPPEMVVMSTERKSQLELF